MPELFQTSNFIQHADTPRFLLQSITVYNWGPFSGLQSPAEIHPEGSAIIGATGSGKTTLIDALMTLLVANPDYNLASTGGHDKNDRSIISYVRGLRGVASSGGEGDNVMRPGKTCTGLSATYSDGKNTLKIGALLYFDGPGNTAADLGRLWYVSQNHPDDLTDHLRLFDTGGKAALKRYAKANEHFDTFDRKKGYLAMLRRFFEVGDNAFNLLNRAAGLKQLDSINQIFRELVLDNKPMYDRALKVAESFDNLEIIHHELLDAKRQLEALLPIEKENRKWTKQRAQEQDLRALRNALPVWLARQERDLWNARMETYQSKLTALRQELETAQQQEQTLSVSAETLQTRYMEQGGSVLEQLKRTIAREEAALAQLQSALAQYNTLAQTVGFSAVESADQFAAQQQSAQELLTRSQADREEQSETLLKLRAESLHLAKQYQELQAEKDEISRRPKSNIPAPYQQFREDMATQLDLPVEDLPYMAEMIEVKPDERAWTGAIERALGAERLRLLVPVEHFAHAKRWVNQRDNRLHVRLFDLGKARPAREPYADSFLHKLTTEADSRYTEALWDILIKRDRHCVDSVDQLDAQEHSMTIEGLMYDRQGRFDKQDQRPLNKGWMTGFDNAFQLQAIEEELANLSAQLRAPLAEEKRLKSAIAQAEQTALNLNRLQDYNFDRIDVFSQQQSLDAERARLAQLEDPTSDLAQLRRDYEDIRAQLSTLRGTLETLQRSIGSAEGQLESAQSKIAELATLADSEVQPEPQAALRTRFPASITLGTIGAQRQEYTAALLRDLDQVAEKIKSTESNLCRYMEKAKLPDTGALQEADTQLVDIPTYLDRLDTLRREDLPQRKRRFLEYLNESSDQGVSQLLAKIENEVAQIKDRLEQLNATLGKVEYKADKYLMLDATEVSNDALRDLRIAEKKLTTARLTDDGTDDGEARYRALKAMVQILRDAGTNRRIKSSQALLDARYRLEFFVREVERGTNRMSDKIAGSQTGSGGEKEQMASYILTASLSYALCPKGATRPKYATIVLDEAFSKSSQSAASKIIQALREFGLHPLFVTPNKEMSLLKANTASAILVHQAKLCSLSWSELDEIYQKEQQS